MARDMTASTGKLLSKNQRFVLFAISLGNILEWYDIYLYIYWSPYIAKLFFQTGSLDLDVFNMILVFSLGFLVRPLGGLVFGRIGDRLGRKQSFLLSIFLMTIPTFLMGFLPTYQQVGLWAPVFLILLRVFQTFPSGGELPGVFCYLYESADIRNRKFMTSFAGVGNQMGIVLGAIEAFFFETFFSEQFLITWGWRLSFIIGGCLGLIGIVFRYTLHETSFFQIVGKHHHSSEKPLSQIFKTYWKKMLLGISFGCVQVISFHYISIWLPVFLYKFWGVSVDYRSVLSVTVIFLMTVLLPLIGYLSEKVSIKMIVISAVVLNFISFSILHFTKVSGVGINSVVLVMYAVSTSCFTATWPYLITNCFPIQDRYTCLGLSFNIADGVFGGLVTVFGFYMVLIDKAFNVIYAMSTLGCIISLIAFILFKDQPYEVTALDTDDSSAPPNEPNNMPGSPKLKNPNTPPPTKPKKK